MSVDAALGVDEILWKLKGVCLAALKVERRGLPRTEDEEGWDRVEVERHWIVERRRHRNWDTPWTLRRSWKEEGEGEVLMKHWESSLRFAIAKEASYRW
jgi:hypothetical protein